MTLSFKEERNQQVFRAQVRAFARDVLSPQVATLDAKEKMSPELLGNLANLGLFGCTLESCYGGAGRDELSYLMAVEELAAVDGSHAAIIASHNSLGIGSLSLWGNEEQKRHYLPGLCTGKELWGFALTEKQSGSDVKNCATQARELASGGFALTGSKVWITNTACAQNRGVTVMAMTSPHESQSRELSCFIVPREAKGFQQIPMTGKMMWRATATGHLVFNEVHLAPDQLLGQRGQGMAQMMTVLNSGRLSIAAMGVGLARGAYELARQHALTKKTFGRHLIDHQGVAFKLAAMVTKVEAARNLLWKACWLKSTNQGFSREASMAKLFCSEVAEFCVREGSQIVAGEGLFHGHPMERFYRDVAILRIGEGTSEIQKLVISRSLKNHP
ncbi:MAG: acyl-CoA dehydrogenase family protein [Proteobacteria bacterium]|nr:acyl-CoA dehydrogenase family protein [Pseudomonadota bacterium]